MLQETRNCESFENRHLYDMNKLSDRIEALSCMQSDKAQDLGEQIKDMTLSLHTDMEDQNRQVLTTRSQIDVQQQPWYW